LSPNVSIGEAFEHKLFSRKLKRLNSIELPPSQAPAWEGLAGIKEALLLPSPAKREFRFQLRCKAELCNEAVFGFQD